MKKTFQRMLLFLTFVVCFGPVVAQQRQISGTVRDGSGTAVQGASILQKGISSGTSTDEDGNFVLVVSGTNPILVISSVGFASREFAVGNSSSVNITLEAGGGEMEEVVVTALGVKRERKALGYAVQEVKGESLAEAREPNLANTLSGRVAGLQVVRSSTGPAGSSKIILRGNNSLTGNNQPLIVVDGVPIDNFTGASNNDYWNPSLDMGNGLADINSEDIETLTVLKGPSAAALYGSRAGNGVILITTKTGRRSAGIGLTVSSTLGLESIFTTPKFQNEFGQGLNGIHDPLSNFSWGPKISGQSVQNWNGDNENLASYNNVENFFRTGITSTHNVSFQQQYDNTSIYTSFNRSDITSMIPGVKLERMNLMSRAVSKFGKDNKWSTDTKIQYTNSAATNRPMGGSRPDNSFFTIYQLPRSMDVRKFNPSTTEDGNMIWYGSSSQINPYWNNLYNQNSDKRDRFIMTGALRYEFAEWLNAEIRGGGDLYTTNTESKVYGGSPLTPTGRYGLGKQTFSETNFSGLITAAKDDIFGKFGGQVSLGGNLMSTKWSSLNSNSGGNFVVPNFFSLNNGENPATTGQGFSQKKINSVYGTVQLNYDGFIFVDATFRNDWSSSLHPDNRSFFYPSVSTSLVITEMIQNMGGTLPFGLSFGKIRASYAAVGNDLPAYQLYNNYTIGNDPLGNTVAGRNSTYFDANVRSELIKSIELGAEIRFVNNRIGFDFAYYKSNATRQLLDLPMDPLSGYSRRKINAGDIENQGFELQVDGRVLTNPQSLMWNIQVNYSQNRNRIKSLSQNVTSYPLGGFDDVRVVANEGSLYGDIYGTTYLRVKDTESPSFGALLLDANGLPQRDAVAVKLGNQQATGLLGVTNTFAYKGFVLGFLVDARFGGQIFSGTLADMQQQGTGSQTVVNGDRADIVVDGVVYNSTTQKYETNTTAVRPQLYWTAVSGGAPNLGIIETNIYDASNIRLRNIQLAYNIPQSLLGGKVFQRARVGVSCNNVWMISSHMNGLDPESVFATGTNAVGFENASPPTSRTILFNLTLGF